MFVCSYVVVENVVEGYDQIDDYVYVRIFLLKMIYEYFGMNFFLCEVGRDDYFVFY